MHRIRPLILILALFGPVGLLLGQSPVNLSADAGYRAELSRPASYQVDFRVAVMPPAGTKKLSVWLPLPQENAAQQIEDRQLETFPRAVRPTIDSEPLFGNTFAYFEFASPQGAQLITHRFTARIQQMDWRVDYSSITQPESWPDSFRPYQRVDPRTKEGAQLQSVLREIGSNKQSAADRLVGAMRWVDRNLAADRPRRARWSSCAREKPRC